MTFSRTPKKEKEKVRKRKDLDLCSQGQTVRAFFIRMGFSLICHKCKGNFGQTCQRTSNYKWNLVPIARDL